LSQRPKKELKLVARTEQADAMSYWRSVLAQFEAAPTAVERTQDPGAGHTLPTGGVPELARRDLFKLLGASVALAGLSGCTQRPREQILPYVRQPPEVRPGIPLQYATSTVLDGYAVGLLVKSREGRPIKVEGNPGHPASLGATSVHEQASVLSLYDPTRLRAPLYRGMPSSWQAALVARPEDARARIWCVLPPQSSPLLAAWLGRLRARYPEMRLCFHSPLSRRTAYEAAELVFGRALDAQYDFTRAHVTLALDADFLGSGPMTLRWARDFSRQRELASPASEMSRLYQVEARLTPTGSVADHRLPVQARQVALVASMILSEISSRNPEARALLPLGLPQVEAGPHATWVRAVAADLWRARGQSVVIAGDAQPRETHVLAHALNTVLGNLGQTVRLTEAALIEPLGGETLPELVRAIQSQQVDSVLVLDANPVYTAPPELDLARWLGEVQSTIHLTYHANETSKACAWVLPLSHYLESWGDARAYDGTLSYVQPLIEPLYPTKSAVEVVAALTGRLEPSGHSLLREHWQAELGPRFDAEWGERLAQGLAAGSAFGTTQAKPDWARALAGVDAAFKSCEERALELHLHASPAVYDGRFAANAWLLELPDPITKQCWGNAAVLSPRTAERLGVVNGRVVQLSVGPRSLRAPVLVMPGYADDSISLALGYGQSAPGTLADGVGVNAYVLGPSTCSTSVELSLTDASEALALTQSTLHQEGRALALVASLAQYRNEPQLAREQRGAQPSLFPIHTDKLAAATRTLQWAMTIDPTLCTGCSACVIACQAENNVPVVGMADVLRGREMHWLRIDRYFEASGSATRVIHQPMLCQHCEAAPCEYVCPVNATVHSPDGLNEMIYNRCIGTRFCSNNCPYKVRRFNWFEYSESAGTQALQRNPDVTVRERGVMEKCTFCVQRIRGAERAALVGGRTIQPGEVMTACQQACPTRAIQFGALSHTETDMVRWRNQERAYSVLHELGTRPRTQYLVKIVNTHPELEG
jgi:Fe-S-cluster-containing dehydrogenase component/anaerobic selenocysteine-containing dehydrogenase